MKKNVLSTCILLLLLAPVGFGQTKNLKRHSSDKFSLNGQWRGYFNTSGDIVSNSDGSNTEYILELDVTGDKVLGYSYSYFQNRTYYVICSLKGTYDKSSKTISVSETARVKGQTPPYWEDCLQMHTLTYKKVGNTETLVGKWRTAPGQQSDCGFGNTTLERRTVKGILSAYNKTKNKNTPFAAPVSKTAAADSGITNKNIVPPSITVPIAEEKQNNPIPSKDSRKKEVTKQDEDNTVKSEAPASKNLQSWSNSLDNYNYEKRTNELVKIIEIHHEIFRVDIYDNGVIDGDSVSLFYNGKLIISHLRLSDRATTFTLNANTGKPTNELIMYAENLGEIPPNTAMMIITDGQNRYEVPIVSDLKSSGSIRFVFKPQTGD